MTSQCVGSSYANGFLRLITGTPRWRLSGLSPEDPERLLGWSGSRSVQGSSRRVPRKPAGWWGPSPAAGSLDGAGCELCCGRVKQEGGWARWYLRLLGGCPSLVARDVHSLLACGWEWPGEMCPPSSFPLTFPSSCQLGPEGPGEDSGQQCPSWPHPHHPGWPTVNWDVSEK